MITKPTITPPAEVVDVPSTPVSKKDQVACLKTLAGINNGKSISLKEKVKMLRDLAIKTAKTYVKTIVEAFSKPLTSLIDSLVTGWENLKKIYYGYNEEYQKLKRSDLEKLLPIPPTVSGIASCLLKGTIPLSSDVVDPTKGIVVTTSTTTVIETAPRSNNPADVGLMKSVDLIKAQQDSESKFGLAPKTEAVLLRLTDSLDSPPNDLRDVVESVTGKSPELDAVIKLHPLGKDYSDYATSTILAYTPDKPALPLGQWKPSTTPSGKEANVPEAIKRQIKDKLPQNILVEIEYVYGTTNEKMVANLPKEFPKNSTNILKLNTVAPGHHIMGDTSFFNKHIDGSILIPQYLPIVISVSGPSIYLNKTLTPVVENITISKNPYEDTIEGYPCTIDLRGNIIRTPITVRNESAIEPVVI